MVEAKLRPLFSTDFSRVVSCHLVMLTMASTGESWNWIFILMVFFFSDFVIWCTLTIWNCCRTIYPDIVGFGFCHLSLICFPGTGWVCSRFPTGVDFFSNGCYEFDLRLIPALIFFLLLSTPSRNELGFLLLSLMELAWGLSICIGM